MTLPSYHRNALIFLTACLSACSGDDGADGLNGVDGTNAAEQIVIATESLAPGETMTVAHDFTNYSADLAFEYNGVTWDHSEFGLVYNPVNDFESPFVAVGDPDSQVEFYENTVTFETAVPGYAVYMIRANSETQEYDIAMETLNEAGEVQSFQVLTSAPDGVSLINVNHIRAFEMSSGVLTLVLAGAQSYVMTFVDNALTAVLDVSDLGDLSADGDGWRFSTGYSSSQYATRSDGDSIVACTQKPVRGEDLNVYYPVALQSFNIATDGTISLGNQRSINGALEQYSGEDCVVTSRPQGGIAAFFEREGDFYSEIWAGMYDASLEVEMEAVVADNYLGHRTISCNTQDVCVAGYEQGGPDLYNYVAFSSEGVLERAVLDDNEGDYFSSTALADDVFLLSATEDDSLASYLWVIAPDGTLIQEPHLMSPFRAVDDDRRNTLLPATGNNARFFYNTYESSNVSNYVSVTVSQNRLAEAREEGQYLVTNKSLHNVEVIVTLTGVTD